MNDRIDRITDDFTATFGGLSTAELNWKPNPDTWSIGQNIDHLITTNQTYFPLFAAVRNGNHHPPWIAKIGFLVGWMGGMVLKAVNPDRRMKTKTFPIWEPSQSEVPGDILQRFSEHQAILKEEIGKTADQVALDTPVSSPANSYIVYRLGTAIDIIVTHEERHFAQAKEVWAD